MIRATFLNFGTIYDKENIVLTFFVKNDKSNLEIKIKICIFAI